MHKAQDLAPTTSGLEPRRHELHAKFFQGLANPTRLKIVELLLDEGEMSVGQLIEAVGMSQGQVSNQLACLKWCGFVSARSQGRRVFYHVSDPRVRDLVALARSIVSDHTQAIQTCTRMDG